jgi:hypothetical protein
MKRVLIIALLLVCATEVHAQRGARPATPSSAQAAAPIDLTGYWVSLVTEDWRWRMVTPPKGDYTSVPLNAAGRRLADMWDPDKDDAAGEQCKAYGAAALMRVPGRLHVTWANPNTLRIDTDAGTQTRMLQFGNASNEPGEPAWQGNSAAQWEFGGGTGRGMGTTAGGQGSSLKVVTTRMRPGYLRKNGVPYSGNTVLTEYFTRFNEPNGDSWLVVMSIVEDPRYLTQPFITSTHFKKLPDSSGWNPAPCSAH